MIESAEDDFESWINQQTQDDPKRQELYEFHGYIRENGLDTGTRLGYRRNLSGELNDDGYLEDYDEVLEDDADSSLKKYREFLENRGLDNENSGGDYQ